MVVEIISGKPYIDDGDIRIFDVNQPAEEYVWHRDREDRVIEVLEGQGWQLQFENSLPFLLREKMRFEIPEGEYHRLLKGYDNLKIKLHKKTKQNVVKN